MSSSVTQEPSHDPLGSAISSVVDEEGDDGEELGGEMRGGEERAVGEQPPVEPRRLRGGGGSAE
jgi:hypothetical protein